MKAIRLTVLMSTLMGAQIISGCASQSQLQRLQADVDALRQLSEEASHDANLALQETALLKNDIAAVRQSSESASADAAATRKLLEQMNARLERGSANNNFK